MRKDLSLGLVGAKMDGGKWQGITILTISLFRIWNFFFIYASRNASPQACSILFKIWKACIYYKKISWGDNWNICLIAWQTQFIGRASRKKKHENWTYNFYVLAIIGCCRALHKQTFNLHRCVILWRISSVWWERFTKILKATWELWSWNSTYILWNECPSLERPSDTVEGLT